MSGDSRYSFFWPLTELLIPLPSMEEQQGGMTDDDGEGSKEFSLLPLNLDEATERIADGREIAGWNERYPNLGAAR